MLNVMVRIACISIVVILIFSTVAIYKITSQDVIRDAGETAVKASRAMYEQQRDVLTSTDGNGKIKLHSDKDDIAKLDAYFRSYLTNFDILKIKIYSLSKEIIYSSDTKIIGEFDSNNRRLNKALNGEVDSHSENKDRTLDLSNEAKFNVTVVETYIPILAGNKTIGVFEIYTDVTTCSKEITHIVLVTLICLAAILFLVFAGSYLVVRNAAKLVKDTQKNLAEKVIQLEEALANVKLLEGVIPICMDCKKIRDDMASWQQLEHYISNHSEAVFSHGICPDCYEIRMEIIKSMK
jgi:hypothetical protein